MSKLDRGERKGGNERTHRRVVAGGQRRVGSGVGTEKRKKGDTVSEQWG